ncbi:MAG TPA: DUF3105 domain-containing protein [Mycobacteriales bacterium]|jgi:Protein of unknown function (DUF3105).
MAKTNSAKRTGKSSRRRPPVVVPGRPKPWGLIAAAVAVVVFAVGVIGYAVNKNIEARPQDPAKLAAAATKIPDIVVKNFPSGQHSDQPIKYDSLPPFGGPHNPVWADCTGTVYDKPIRDESAVHALEHGSVWVTYSPDLPKNQVDTLKKLVEGKNYTLMSPYPGLKSAVSLQSWGHQLFVDSANDSRVKQFITDLRQNPQTTPEYGANCVNPEFKANPASPDQDGAQSLPPATAPSGTPAPTASGSSDASASPSAKP